MRQGFLPEGPCFLKHHRLSKGQTSGHISSRHATSHPTPRQDHLLSLGPRGAAPADMQSRKKGSSGTRPSAVVSIVLEWTVGGLDWGPDALLTPAPPQTASSSVSWRTPPPRPPLCVCVFPHPIRLSPHCPHSGNPILRGAPLRNPSAGAATAPSRTRGTRSVVSAGSAPALRTSPRPDPGPRTHLAPCGCGHDPCGA